MFNLVDTRRSSYVEFVGITRVRRGTTCTLDENEFDQSEKIINDIVNMDAGFDLNQLPDLSIGET
jgi:hypothetical protein